MSVTKLKTVGSWRVRRPPSGALDDASGVRGRIITGLLTGDDALADTLPVAPGRRGERPDS